MADQNIDYGAVLADLESKKSAIEASINGIRMMLGQASVTFGAPAAFAEKAPPGSSFSKMSLVEAIESYLRDASQMKSTGDIVDALEAGGVIHNSVNFRKTVSTTLNQKCKDKGSEITKVKDKWGLSSWGPGMKRAKNSNLGTGTEPSAEEIAADVAARTPDVIHL